MVKLGEINTLAPRICCPKCKGELPVRLVNKQRGCWVCMGLGTILATGNTPVAIERLEFPR